MPQMPSQLLRSVIGLFPSVIMTVLLDIALVKPYNLCAPVLGVIIVDKGVYLGTEVIVGTLTMLESDAQVTYLPLSDLV